jgi:Peptidase family M28
MNGLTAIPAIARQRRWAALLLLVLAAAVLPMQQARAARDRALEERLREHITVLASDEFGGRQPGTEGEAKTLRYLGRQWFEIGLQSGTNQPGNDWFAPVTLVAREPALSRALVNTAGRQVTLSDREALVFTSGKRALVRNAPLLFVGRGENLVFSRAELAGRVAVLLDAGRDSTVRQDMLLGQGAAAVLTVLDASRTLGQVAARRKRSGYALASNALGGDLDGFVTAAAMERMLGGTRHSLRGLEAAAARANFAPVTLDVSVSLEASTREATIHTYNLIGRLPGRNPQAGAVLLVAHWDHFGTCAEPPAEDLVCNGAIDNASGLAALTEIARRLARGPRNERDIYFLATTAEELGLLGAHAFAEAPPIPLARFVAAFNLDTVAIAPSGTAVAIVGEGMTGLDAGIARVVKREKRRLIPGKEANTYVQRQDGWALLQNDVPTVMVSSAYGEIERVRRFFDTHYHRPGDNPDPAIELGGAAEDVKLHVALARWFADPKSYSPQTK